MPQWMTRHKWFLVVGAVFIGLFIFAACDDDDDEAPPAETPPPAAAEVEALAGMCFPVSCTTALREAIEQGIIDQFIFVDGTKNQPMFDEIGVENFEGMYGTAPGAADPETGATFDAAYGAFSGRSVAGFVFMRETYDATYLIALAAVAANSTDPADIRDHLRYVANPPGETISIGADEFARAVEILEGGGDINYEGAAGPQDLDVNGDVGAGAIEIWKIVDGLITTQEVRPFEVGTDIPAGEVNPAAEAPTDALNIGLLIAFTGDLASFGEPIADGARMAREEINSVGGVFGQDLVLSEADTGTAEATGIESARTLIDVEGVSAIIGALSSGVTIPIAETVTGPGGILQISPASTSPALSGLADNDFLFRTTISDAAQGVVLADLATELGFTNVCTFFINTAYGQGLSDQFKETFEAQGGTVPSAVPHESEQPTYVSELQTCVGG